MDQQRLLELAGALEERIAAHSNKYTYLQTARSLVQRILLNGSDEDRNLGLAINSILDYLEGGSP